MHLLLFNRAYYPEQSATGQLLTELAEGLVHDHGCRVSIICGVAPKSTACENQPSWVGNPVSIRGVTVFRCAGTSFSKKILAGRICNYLTYFASSFIASRRVKKPDLVLSMTDPPIIGLAALWTARQSQCRFIMAYSDIFPEVSRLLENFSNPLIEKILDQVNRFLIRSADRILALDDDMRNRLIHEKNARAELISIITNWADTEKTYPVSKRNPFSEQHGLADKFVALYAGNFGASQDLEQLLESAALLKGLPDFIFAFVGDGVRKEALQNRARTLDLSHVRFFPYQTKEALLGVYGAADCCIVSLKKGVSGYITPSKLYGVLAAGRPYIAAIDATSETSRIALQFRCGLQAAPGNAVDIAEKIRFLYDHRELCKTMGENARNAAFGFDRKKVIQQYHDLFTTMTATAAPN